MPVQDVVCGQLVQDGQTGKAERIAGGSAAPLGATAIISTAAAVFTLTAFTLANDLQKPWGP